MKQRITSLDLELLSRELRLKLEGYRLTNIYNIADTKRQFLLKFNKPDSKLNVVVDCGLRIHLTDFTRHIPQFPSDFVIKLRKHLKSKRLTKLRQVPGDRIIVLQFAEGLFYLVLEFFSAGNVILLDENKTILSLQRVVKEHENKVGQDYEMFDDSIFFDTASENLANSEFKQYDYQMLETWFHEEAKKLQNQTTLSSVPLNNGKKLKVFSIHKLLLTKEPHLSSDLLQKHLKIANINPSLPCLEFLDKITTVLDVIKNTENEYHNLLNTNNKRGYIVAKKNPNYVIGRDADDLEYVYETFNPFEPFIDETHRTNSKIIIVDGPYNLTLDKFFTTIESSKYALKIQTQEEQAKKKIEDAHLENKKRIDALINVQTSNEQKGYAIIANTELIETTKYAVQGLVDQQMDWNTIEKLIKNEQVRGNEVAENIILPLNLKENTINMILPLKSETSSIENSSSEEQDEYCSESDNEPANENTSDEESDISVEQDVSDFVEVTTIGNSPLISKKSKHKRLQNNENSIIVSIDLSLSAYANASRYFDTKKKTAEKQKRVEENAEKAMKNIEQGIETSLQRKLKESHEVLKKIRKPYFFEKYHWFISSEKILVLMGKSSTETDQIYSKYIEDDDIYMSNSFDTQVWIKNPEKIEISPNTLMQAGVFCMSSSEAWSKKIASSPWWCKAKNVSKFDKEGNTCLEPGKFILKNENEKHSLPPAQLVMGIGLLWKVKTDKDSEESDTDEGPGEDGEHEKAEARRYAEDGDNAYHESTSMLNNDLNRLTIASADDTNSIVKGKYQRNIDNSEENSAPESRNKDILNDENGTITTENGESIYYTNIIENMNRNVRGKKGKLKKMKKKYSHQDESERLLKLQALGTLQGIQKRQKQEQEELERQHAREYKKEMSNKQKQMQTLKFIQNEKVRVNYDKFKNELKPTLDINDTVVDIVPIFAPWPSLLKYKYKVKIQPGSSKKTKTVNEILRHFVSREVDSNCSNKELGWPSEYELIKGIKDQDIIPLLCVDKLKASIPGQVTKDKNTTQKGGKTKRKQEKISLFIFIAFF
ncbi:hypothetical protein TBLA_0C00610 [Henningerozyma blattae CBS 6284]|uniref:Ribosome quality control complex subunit 2 n=1 Tax=Henningerozyma blattae (strain ATCC 34711 / CBS 6284 / DSM 70876 / NBRC 10599 / NRRL Y-10934 / UCD 77-7) TaxID=1071380 RepID=I2H0H5_HENB6|nr:hypothetical protein TBLA_0C00610 [Tetrapisispora blattae CBS 6284]CCH59877.1 hypothetical protein TBLA_0C00610 [Tetrapisispora blattae CBS 6284]